MKGRCNRMAEESCESEVANILAGVEGSPVEVQIQLIVDAIMVLDRKLEWLESHIRH
jgi:hypothetical protein